MQRAKTIGTLSRESSTVIRKTSPTPIGMGKFAIHPPEEKSIEVPVTADEVELELPGCRSTGTLISKR